ncbi:MAG: NAD-dependent epimerase/dehydratase family protein [Chitinophagaceae bacterium]
MVLVTGGSGMVGGELITQLLAHNVEVKAIYNNTLLPHALHANLHVVQCDILDTCGLEEMMQDVTHVYHCAAIVSFNPKRKDEIFKINIEGTTNVVNAALDAGVQKLLFVSSVAALGRLREGYMVTEEMVWTEETSNSNYGKSKYLSEMEVWRGIAEGLPSVIVNPSLILGAGNWTKGSSGIFKSAYDEFPWYTDGVTGFVDVRDVAKAMIMLMESEISSERFILNATNTTYHEVFDRMAVCFGKKPPYKKVTKFIADVVWRLEAIKAMFSGKDPLVTKETATTALAKVYFDNSKLLKFLPEFTYHTIEKTIDDTCRELNRKFNLN